MIGASHPLQAEVPEAHLWRMVKLNALNCFNIISSLNLEHLGFCHHRVLVYRVPQCNSPSISTSGASSSLHLQACVRVHDQTCIGPLFLLLTRYVDHTTSSSDESRICQNLTIHMAVSTLRYMKITDPAENLKTEMESVQKNNVPAGIVTSV